MLFFLMEIASSWINIMNCLKKRFCMHSSSIYVKKKYIVNNFGGLRLIDEIRIELRFDHEKDKDIIDFIDENGSTRAGFIKNILKLYKNQLDTELTSSKNEPDENQYETKEVQTLSDLERKLLAIIQYENNQGTSSFLFFLKEFTGHSEEKIQATLTQLVQKKWLTVNDPPH